MRTIHKLLILLALLNISIPSFGQNNDDDVESSLNKKGFHAGLYIGSLFANNYSASLYDGYGFDFEGNRNNFANSFMYQKIIVQYGGGNGQPDQIAAQLGVDHSDWSFTESDMPVNVNYSAAFLIGLNSRYVIDRKNMLLLNLNTSQLTANGNFTITTVPPAQSTQINKSIKTFGIKGGEQRLMIQAGYQRLFGESVNLNFFLEGGLQLTVAKFTKNEIMINNLLIDLSDYYTINTYNQAALKKPVGAGFGIFAGTGINLTLNSTWAVQFVYNPSYEKINIGLNPKPKLQNAIGLRAYFSFAGGKDEE